jgi:hypothetical protein
LSRDALAANDLTPAGILRRRNERARSRCGISFTSVTVLTAVVVRWCCHDNLLSTRKDIADAIAEEASVLAPDFTELRRLGLVEVARSVSNKSFYRPTRRGLLRAIEWSGIREQAREASAAE